MKRIISLLKITLAVVAFLVAMQASASAQLLSEIEIDPPSTASDACQYAEIQGVAGTVIQANTYFLSVNSDAGNFGFANQAVNIGGLTVGSNGTILLFNSLAGDCPNRTYGAGTTRVNFLSGLRIGFGSETYLVVRSTAQLATGQDLDTDDNGVFDPAFGITVLDGFALIVNPEEEFVYGASSGVTNISNTISIDQPDAVTRFPGNSSPFLAGAFYFGEIAGSADESTAYTTPQSSNFPVGGVLTPGDVNAPATSSAVSISGRVTTPGGLGLRNAIVTLTDGQGGRRTATTSSFGVYTFEAVPPGAYLIGVSSRRYRFPSRTLQANSSLADVDFIGLE